MKSIFGLIISFLVLTSIASAADEFGVPPCAYFTRSDVVFYGRVAKIENAQKSEDLPEGARKIRFQILDNFKGADNPTFTLFAGAKASSGLEIKSGQNWIIYAANDIVFKTFSISRGVKIEPKTTSGELALLKEVAAGTTPTSISGRVVSDVVNGKYNLDAADVVLEGTGKRLTTKTDADGIYTFEIADAGKYKIELKFPFNANIAGPDNLLGTNLQRGTPTVFRYTVTVNEGDCSFATLKVSG